MVEIGSEKYLDGGISDSIPLEKCRQLGYDKIIVILTRPLEYRKEPMNKLLPKLFYRQYPALVKTLIDRHINYNQRITEIIRAAEQKEIFVIRPSQTLPINRLERDPVKIQAMYELGIADGKAVVSELQAYLQE